MLAEIRDEQENKEVRNFVRTDFNNTEPEIYLWIGLREKLGLLLMFYAHTHIHMCMRAHTHTHQHNYLS